MSLVFRKIKKSKWYKNDGVPWLATNDLQADALADLKTTGNALSVYFVDRSDKEDLDRVVTALAATRERIEEVEYALFEESALSEIGIKVATAEADTPDAVVNTWHRHLVEMSANKIMELAYIIRNEGKKERVLGKRIRDMLIDALISKRIDRGRIKLNSKTTADLDEATIQKKSN